MKKLMFFVFVLIAATVTVNASNSSKNKEVIGEWKYEVPSAPYGYNAGTIVIEEKEGKLTGHTKLDDGYKIDLKDVTYEEGVLKFGLYVDYNYVTLKVTIEGENMKGTVNSPDGAMPITAKKVK
ncbi:hypothetical protein SLH46_13345 [Draconibacterium sp. IB214405]|uniref:hypothetical protein n=1 Tax=Draconibacterium sp. IB214405 TaxID=3097352 RepID=UPI002A1507FE|nr:hypothetical protein [Draconibacterium sp. IB214405]MDX8340178.1 hypothetical protein [Draconibacterium sp. IB214405]